tara:strand:+ start:64139 stop:64996 length:858 start_codon:yes stop_codon:yes gene_type:complete
MTVLKTFQKEDSRFRIYKRSEDKTKGANACRNYGWSLAKGDYIKFFDSDDVMKSQFLENQVKHLDENPNLDFCASYWEVWYADGSTMKNKPYTDIDFRENPVKSYLLESHIFPTPAPLWRKIFLVTADYFNEDLQRGQEADFHFNIMCKSPNYEFVDDFAFLVRVGHDSIKTKGSTFDAQLSIFKYFKNVAKKVSISNNVEKEHLIQYAFFRMAIAFYNMISRSNKNERNTLFDNYFETLKQLSEEPYINKRSRLALGKIALKYLGKGYMFFYYPEFDHRLKIDY